MIERQAHDTPIVIVAFKRPDTTKQVLQAVRAQRPSQLFIICDGARSYQEAEEVKATRDILKNIDWPCQVRHNYADQNMGLRGRIETGLDWVFSHVDRAIILEDDCVPHPSFFNFCGDLLDVHQDDDDVMLIAGDNAHGFHPVKDSYYWSRFALIWGWATWARAWRHYNKGQSYWPAARDSHFLSYVFRSQTAKLYWQKTLQSNYEGGNSWARVWLFSILLREGLCATAGVNLISNIGFGDEATHTKGTNPVRAFPNTQEMGFPLKHPQKAFNDEADALIDKIIYSKDTEIFTDRMAGRVAATAAIPRHSVLRREGMSGIGANALLAHYFKLDDGLREKFHLCTPENRRAFAEHILARGDDSPYLVGAAAEHIEAYLRQNQLRMPSLRAGFSENEASQ